MGPRLRNFPLPRPPGGAHRLVWRRRPFPWPGTDDRFCCSGRAGCVPSTSPVRPGMARLSATTATHVRNRVPDQCSGRHCKRSPPDMGRLVWTEGHSWRRDQVRTYAAVLQRDQRTQRQRHVGATLRTRRGGQVPSPRRGAPQAQSLAAAPSAGAHSSRPVEHATKVPGISKHLPGTYPACIRPILVSLRPRP
jgi:hypothetical protein